MKVLVLLSLVVAACANVAPEPVIDPSYSIIAEQLIPLGDKIREAEERMASQRIIGGLPAVLGEIPYQAGLLTSYLGINGTGVCGGSLISTSRVVTAAHCWFDGQHQGWRVTVVLGSVLLFSGGTRMDTSAVALHNQWTPALIRNDIAVIYLPSPVTPSETIAPIALPAGAEVGNSFVGAMSIASGFGLTHDDHQISPDQSLHQTPVVVISNLSCNLHFPLIIQDSNICTSTSAGSGTCRGDSGGPLVTVLNGRRTLIGVTSFGSARGCLSGASAYARITSFIGFLEQHL